MSAPSGNQIARILALDADIQPPDYPLAPDICTIGRSPTCQIVVPRTTVSRLHARIERDGPRYVLRDAGSANGTFVNNRRIYDQHTLKHYDVIGLGPALALLRFIDPDPTVEMASRLRYEEHVLKFVLDQQPVDLTPAQFRLLYHLHQHAGDVCTRESCCEAIWGRDYDPGLDSQALDGVVAGVRRQLRQVDPVTNFIQTQRGFGYKLVL
jgi:pSer/pThr/pTyr-binding forkhead associated (FHA) protein